MKRIKLFLVLFVVLISSFFAVHGIYGIFMDVTPPAINNIKVSQNTTYTVIHELMNLDGVTYTEHSRTNYSSVSIGTTVSPAVLNVEGFDAPSVQTVTLNSFNNTVITYRYTRKQYSLTINNSNYVTTSTPSGTYYYGQEIHLIADEYDSNNNPFVKWSNNVINRDYTFTLTNNVTISPLYSASYTITYEPNNGDSQIIDYVIPNQALGSLPTVSYNDCVSGSGDYHTRQCTYFYKFEGWYTESTFVHQIHQDFIPTADMTIYAKWNKIYFANDGPFTCTGSNYIDTDIAMFSQVNADKDFVIKFTVEENNGYVGGDRGSIFADMSESGEPYPGVQFYTSNSTTGYTMNINTTGNKQKKSNTGYITGQSVEIKKDNGKVYYKYDNGNYVQINDFSNFNTYFNNNALFCAGINAQGVKYRYFKGVLSGMSVELIDPGSYTIHYDSNGGTGTMPDQVIKIGTNTTLTANAYTYEDASFNGWNTRADGNGTSYPDEYAITSDLGNDFDIITLYAQWVPEEYYYLHFDANGGTGTMADQKFVINDPASPITANTFTRTNYDFRGWNTQADGSGVHYDDEQEVRNLSLVDDDVVTLYAQWWKIEYNHLGDAIFDGTSNTFINTGVNVFSETNINKDFEIRFTYKSVDSDIFTYTPQQPTIFNAKDESNSTYPGFNVRFNTNNTSALHATYRWGGSGSKTVPQNGIATNNAPITFVYKRTNGVVTLQYSYTGFTSEVYTLFNQSSWTLNKPFSTNVAFGGYFDGSNQPGRFFKGTLADMIIIMEE